MRDYPPNPRESFGRPERFTTFVRPVLQELIREQSETEDIKISRVIENALFVHFSHIHGGCDPSMEFQEGMGAEVYNRIVVALADRVIED